MTSTKMTYDPNDQPPPQTSFSNPLDLYAKVDEYHKTIVLTSDSVLSQVEDHHLKNDLPNISVSPLQGKLLQILLRQAIAAAPEEKRSRGEIKVLEVGTLAGYSTIWMGRALKGRDGKAVGKLITLEFEEKHARVSKENFEKSGFEGIIECRVGTAESGMKKLLEDEGGWKSQTDFIFIDADKESSLTYLLLAIELARPGAMIIVDNTVRRGAVIENNHPDPRVDGIRKMNNKIKELEEKGLISAAPVQIVGEKGYDGMTMIYVGHNL